ncbi:chemotaxis protein CheA [Pseudogemmobacter bohemicus]|uniref:chemotaxis protein CheA n=1 Tax=Pseudogemmobacter bohemicus TaxID=2250708 RepID=UPI000DD3CD45|nr:chemotaxis protein CheA [Pseudogemmobacter bohemicus]
MSMQSIRDTFFEECEDLLEALAEGLARMETGAADGECLNAVFRAVHSVKGGAGAFALSDLVAFAHRFETVLDEIRSDRLSLSDEIMHVLLRSADHLADQVEAARQERSIDDGITAGFLANLDACLTEAGFEEPAAEEDFGFSAITLDFGAVPDLPAPDLPAFDLSVTDLPASGLTQPEQVALPPNAPADASQRPAAAMGQRHLIRFTPWPQLYSNGHDPLVLLTSLAAQAEVDITPDLSTLPDLTDFDPAKPCVSWEIAPSEHISAADIDAHFEFVRGLCDLTITPADAPPATLDAPIPPLLNMSAAPVPETAPGDGEPAPAAAEAPPAPQPELDTASENAAPLRRRAPKSEEDAEGRGPKPTLRVDLERVDRLINAVGELIINQAMIEQSVTDLSLPADTEIITHTEDYRLLARDLQEAVMAIRAQPVKPLFQRMSRIVREAAEATGKAARLVTYGEATEVDKTVVERLADPLTHMIRNAVDHGLESAAARIAAGKDPEGTIRLSAAHRSGSVIITISDDGGGLDRSRVLAKAVSRGLVTEGAELADAEIDNLLFLPGFSTAEKISNLSGRGVGLDVVKNAVGALGGRIAISSTLGSGTEFTISLPLTLAVMDGMVISVAGQTMVIPIASVIETIRPSAADLHLLGTSDRLLAIRGRFLPMIDVAECLGFGRRDPAQAPLALLVETDAQTHCALIVDAVLDQRQVVIKGLASNYGAIPGVSAATVLGDGQIALILDTEALTSNMSGLISGRSNAGYLPAVAAASPQPPSPLQPLVTRAQALPQPQTGASHAIH